MDIWFRRKEAANDRVAAVVAGAFALAFLLACLICL